MYKNAPGKIYGYVYNATNLQPETSNIASDIDGFLSQDGGGMIALGNPQPVDGGAYGIYYWDLTDTQTNFDVLALTATITGHTNARFDPVMVYTALQAPQVDVTKINGNATAAAQAKDFFGVLSTSGTGISGAARNAIWTTDLTSLSTGASLVLKNAYTNTQPATLVPNVFNFAFAGDAAPFNVPNAYPLTVGEAFTWLFARFAHTVVESAGTPGTLEVYNKDGGSVATTQPKDPASSVAIGGLGL